MQQLNDLIKLSNLRNFQLYTSNIEGNISYQKLRNCCVAKKLIVVFRREFLRNLTIRCIGVKFSEITETIMPFQYSEVLFY